MLGASMKTRRQAKPKNSPFIRNVRKIAIQDQVDAVMDSFDFAEVKRISEMAGQPCEERVLRQTARRVLAGAGECSGWVTGGGFTALLQEWRGHPSQGALKISLFYGPNSLAEPHTEFGEEEVKKISQ